MDRTRDYCVGALSGPSGPTPVRFVLGDFSPVFRGESGDDEEFLAPLHFKGLHLRHFGNLCPGRTGTGWSGGLSGSFS